MKQWKLCDKAPESFLKSKPLLSPMILQILYNRGITDDVSIDSFLHDTLSAEKVLDIAGTSDLKFYNPFLFRDMEKATDLIIDHIKRGSRIVVYGDYDADGVTSSAVLLEALKALQAKVDVYLPDRVSEGYGLNKTAIDSIVKQGFSLVVTVDNGIRNKDEVIYAKSQGLDIIITDHHILPEDVNDLPPCLIINPADKSDSYPWAYLAGVGVAFKLASALVYKSKLSISDKKIIIEKALDLVAIGTIADMVSMLGENRLLVKRGLVILNQNRRLGLNELMKIAKFNMSKKLEAWNVGWQIGPRLNAASRLGHASNAFALLIEEDKNLALEMATELNQRNLDRQKITENIIADVEQQIDKDNLPSIIIGLANVSQAWNEGVIGLVAGRICEKYYRPTLIITRITEEGELGESENENKVTNYSFKGSGRSIEEINLIESIVEASEFLDKYGGHPMACGFSVKEEDRLEKFKAKITEIADAKLHGLELSPKLKIEVELNIDEVNLELAEELSILAPYGQNNHQPKFISYNLRVDEIVNLGVDGQHIKIRVSDAQKAFAKGIWAISFGGSQEYSSICIGDIIDLVYYIDINDFNGRREVQLKLIDLKTASK